MSTTLFDKVWDSHVVSKISNGPDVLFIDRHMVHEVTSPVAFLGLKNRAIKVLYPERTFATADHNTPTINQHLPVSDKLSANQLKVLEQNSEEHGISYWGLGHEKNGIVHVVGPEYGITLPGATIVCGDSHTSTHGAFGAIAFGIGTSEVEHVLATGCLWQNKAQNMKIEVKGQLANNVSAKDVALYVIGKIGTAGGTGFAIEFCGSTIRDMSIEGRMTLCNMSIEAGAKVGIVAVDDKTINYVKGRPFSPVGENWDAAVKYWKTLHSDADSNFDESILIDASLIKPQVTWGTSPEMVVDINGSTPDPKLEKDEVKAESIRNALKYIHLKPNTSMSSVAIDKVFIGSCTNSRIEDLRIAASVAKGKKIAHNIKLALVVPGSGLVKKQAEDEGLDKIFKDAGFEWREPGCSMCLAMNADKLEVGERCASTSNRNFEGRQGQGSFTHLVSPAIAAASAIAGHFSGVET